ncbi:MAG: imidazole glycerol phosphate synthase subunit HisH [bacterium]|nr:imidazole glycerol phosphate synthase subunit HisH [bacterium]
MIVIVDYGMGNLRSVEKGFEHVGHKAEIVRDPKSILNATALVLPGVGAFRDCMNNLERLKLIDPIVEKINQGIPYLGICLGLQVLFSESEEFGHTRGLNIIPGTVRRFSFDQKPGSESQRLKIPHMGWNTIKKVKSPPILKEVPDRSHLYFVHSYYVVPEDHNVIATTTDYGGEFTSMIWKGNIYATQFHPEKSQDVGLSILKAFAEIAGE